MTATTISTTPIHSRVALWVSAALLLAAVIATTLVLTLSSSHHGSRFPVRAAVQSSQYNQVCAPAPDTRFC
jgi:hypothetical protein